MRVTQVKHVTQVTKHARVRGAETVGSSRTTGVCDTCQRQVQPAPEHVSYELFMAFSAEDSELDDEDLSETQAERGPGPITWGVLMQTSGAGVHVPRVPATQLDRPPRA
jgi:hypothetical protein